MVKRGISLALLEVSGGGICYPLSCLICMVDGLADMIEATKEKGYLTGLVPGLIKKGISMLQYIDDTMLLVENVFSNILHMKFLQYCFEAMSGMSINYHKSEVFIMGGDMMEQERVRILLIVNWEICLWCI
jgi:hypothetical protein